MDARVLCSIKPVIIGAMPALMMRYHYIGDVMLCWIQHGISHGRKMPRVIRAWISSRHHWPISARILVED